MSSRAIGVAARVRSRAPALCLLIAAWAMTSLALAAPPKVSLSEAIKRAVERAPSLDARLSQAEAARQESRRAGAFPDPMLTVGIDNLPVTGDDAFDTGAEEMTTKKVGLRQEIPSRAKRSARQALASRQVDEAEARTASEQLAVRQAAAEAWIALWSAQRQVIALQTLREEAALAAKVAKARVAGGAEPVSDALATEAAVLELDNRIEAARAEAAAAQSGLARWLGDVDVEVDGEVPNFDVLPVSKAQLLAAVDRTGSLLPVTAQVETAAAAIDAARADKRADWSVEASYGQREGARSDMLMVEVGIGLPLFSRNRQDRGIAAREADYQAALSEREDLRRQEAARIRAELARWEGLKRRVKLYESSLLPLSRDRSMTTLAAYRAGGDLRPWLDARRDELDIYVSHIEQQDELGQAWAALAFLLPSETQP